MGSNSCRQAFESNRRENTQEQTMYAIVKTGGKQYRVEVGNLIQVEKIEGELNARVELTEVLMVNGDNGLQVGQPMLSGVKVIAKIQDQELGKKINAITFKAKKNERKRYGHRQQLTRLRIESIEA